MFKLNQMLHKQTPCALKPAQLKPGMACLCPATTQVLLARSSILCSAHSTLYDVLGVPAGASELQIKHAYRRRARELHPDVSKARDAHQRFLQAREAYETLCCPEARAKYDNRLAFQQVSVLNTLNSLAYQEQEFRHDRRRKADAEVHRALFRLLLKAKTVALTVQQEISRESSHYRPTTCDDHECAFEPVEPWVYHGNLRKA